MSIPKRKRGEKKEGFTMWQHQFLENKKYLKHANILNGKSDSEFSCWMTKQYSPGKEYSERPKEESKINTEY